MPDNIQLNIEDGIVITSAGSRNERGFVNGLDRQGFTPTKCGAELIANCIDAFATLVKFILGHEFIKLFDNGIGMTREKLVNMFDANRENHYGDKSMGVSGIGGIISNYQFSKNNDGQPSEVTLYTKHMDDTYLKATIPWDYIYENKIYDEQVKIRAMNEDEIETFMAERNYDRNSTGTTIIFPYSEVLKELLISQFKPSEADCRNLDNWWPIIFGKINANILLDKCDGRQPIRMKKYDYFCDPDHKYYDGKFKWDIFNFCENGKNRFVCLDPRNNTQYVEITQNANGFSKEPKSITIDPRKIENANIIKFTGGMRIDKNIFDINNPREPTATFSLNDYDGSFMIIGQQKDIIKEFCSKTPIYRNDQRVTSLPLEGFKCTSSRAGGELLLKIVLHRTEISYETFSKQENMMDNIHGIQQNKNQNQNEFPKQYTRLIEFLKNYDYERIRKYFDDVIETRRQILVEQQRIIRAERLALQQRLAEERRLAQEEERRMAEEEQLAEQQRLAEQPQMASEQSSTHEESSESDDDNEEEYILNNSVSDNISNSSSDTEDPNEQSETDDASDDEFYDSDNNSILEESKNWETQAIQLLSQHVSSAEYSSTNGKQLYDFVINFIQNSHQ
jgi:hypothetical protein